MNTYYYSDNAVPPPEYDDPASRRTESGPKGGHRPGYGPGPDMHGPDMPGRRPGEKRPGRRRLEKTHPGRVFLRMMELLTVALSFLYRSRIARFLTAKASMDVVVEVTAVFGRNAGHRLSTFFAFLAAEPALIAVFVTLVILLLELIAWTVRHIRRSRVHHRPPAHPPV